MSRPCICDKPECRLCWLYHNDSNYRTLWNSTDTPTTVCQHRGEVITTAPCTTCKGVVHLKIFACAVHTRCTSSRPIPGTACCTACPDKAPLPTN